MTMKKHFLSLMLMALLPLVGWAQGAISLNSGYEVKLVGTGAYVYNGAAQEISLKVQKTDATQELNAETDYDVVFYNAAGTAEIEGDLINAGTYQVAARGKEGSNYTGETPKLTFDITPKPLSTVGFTVTVEGPVGGFTYDGEEKEFESYTLTDDGIGEAGTLLVEGANADYTAVYDRNTNASTGLEADGEGAVIIFSGRGNYQGTLEYHFAIAQADLPAVDVEDAYTFIPVDANPVYSAAEVTTLPTITVMNGETELEPGTDFEVRWYRIVEGEDPYEFVTKTVGEGEAEEVVPSNPVHAGDYFAMVYGKGNYAAGEGITVNEGDDAWKLTVDQKPLMIYVQDKSKTYDAVAIEMDGDAISDAEVIFTGLLAADNELKAGVTATFAEGVVVPEAGIIAAGEYPMVPANTAALAADYDITAMATGTYTIEKRKVTVTAKNQTFAYTGEDQSAGLNTVVATEGDDATVEIQPAETDEETGELTTETGVIAADETWNDNFITIALKEGVVIKEKTNAAYTGAIEISETPLGEEEPARNYEIVGVAGNVVMEGQGLTLIAPTITKEYGYTIDFSKDFKVVNTAGLKKDDWKVAPTYKVTDAEGIEVTAESGVLPIGTYTISLTNAEAIVPDNYEYDADDVYDGELIIGQATLDFELATIRLNATSTEDDLNAYQEDAVTFKNLVDGDELGYKLVFNEAYLNPAEEEGAAPTLKSIEELGEAIDEDGVLANAYTLVKVDAAEGEENDNDKYILPAGADIIYGSIIVGAANSLVLDPTDTQLAQKIADADGVDSYVSFANLEMNIGEWYAMVLPFDIDPKAMVEAADRYVIFNELNEAGTTDQNFKFTLKFEPIEAGTPFLVKFAANTDDDEEGATVDWADFVFPAAGNEIIDGINPVVTDYVTFTGTYTAFSMQNNKKGENEADLQDRVWWLCDTGYNGKNTWLKPTNKPHTVAPMEAYLIAADGWTDYAPTFTVEDFDGQTTAIKSLSADKINNLNVVADGWYTVGGMKLQGAPTQKGVYINNGKKVVVK
jgi:hypothetical protein